MPKIRALIFTAILAGGISSAPVSAGDPADFVDISTTNLYGITASLRKENPKLEGAAVIATRAISPRRAVVLVGTGSFPWIDGTFRLFLVDPSSGAIVKSVAAFTSVSPGNVGPDIKTAGPGYVTIVQEDMDNGAELARTKYFFDELSTAAATSQNYKPVRISAITRFGESLYLTGQTGENGIMIRLGLKNEDPAPGDWEIIDSIGGDKLSPITLAKTGDDGLRLYTPSETYAYDGKAWTRASGADAGYFRPAKDPCSGISTDEIFKDFTLYEKCDKERHVQGDAGLVGYEGRCETENPGEYAWLPDSYTGRLERHAVLDHIADIAGLPQRRFFVYNSAMGYEARTGVYEIKNKKCFFYPMPVPANDILKRFRPERAAEGCGLNDKMGPFQKLGDRIWFCKNFYGGEGQCGVGAAGYFDTKAKVFEILYSSQTAKWSCSALLAEDRTVWLGLEHIGEGFVNSGGLAALDIVTNSVTTYEVPSGISAIQRAGDSIIIGTGDGIYSLNAEGKASFLGPEVDETGNYQLYNH